MHLTNLQCLVRFSNIKRTRPFLPLILHLIRIFVNNSWLRGFLEVSPYSDNIIGENRLEIVMHIDFFATRKSFQSNQNPLPIPTSVVSITRLTVAYLRYDSEPYITEIRKHVRTLNWYRVLWIQDPQNRLFLCNCYR
jgi:hypothetical protein